MKKILLPLLFLLSFYMKAQEEIISFSGNFKNVQQTFNIVDRQTGNFALFLQDRDQVLGVLYDKNNSKIAELSAPDLSGKFESFIGYQIKGKTVNLFMNTANGRSYGRLMFDFQNGKSSSEEIDFKLKGEKYINATTRGDQFYLFSIPKGGNLIKVYLFGQSPDPKVNELNFSNVEFLNIKNQPEDLYSFLSDSEALSSNVDAGEIVVDIPNSLEATSKHLKFYNVGDEVVLSMDKSPRYTYLIHINLNTFDKNVERVQKPHFEKSVFVPTTNSFLNNGKLYQIAATADMMKFQILDLKNNNTLLKEITLVDDDDIAFKNTPIIQEKGGMYADIREMEKTSKFLRKIKNADIGISAYKENGIEQLTLGSTKEIQNPNPFLMYGAIGGIAAVLITKSFNPLSSAYTGYTTTKSVRITGLFDENYNHIDGEVPQNPFDRIKEFADGQKKTTAETIFRINGTFYWGAYFKESNNYKVYKF